MNSSSDVSLTLAINFRLFGYLWKMLSPVSTTQVNNLSPVSATPMNNLSLVSATPAINCLPESTPGALFCSPILLIPAINLSPVSLSPAIVAHVVVYARDNVFTNVFVTDNHYCVMDTSDKFIISVVVTGNNCSAVSTTPVINYRWYQGHRQSLKFLTKIYPWCRWHRW